MLVTKEIKKAFLNAKKFDMIVDENGFISLEILDDNFNVQNKYDLTGVSYKNNSVSRHYNGIILKSIWKALKVNDEIELLYVKVDYDEIVLTTIFLNVRRGNKVLSYNIVTLPEKHFFG